MTTTALDRAQSTDPLDHQGLVYQIAIRYRGRGIDLADLVQEGQFGLIRAAEKFDPERGCKFSTYASHWVKNFILAAIRDQAKAIRVPAYIQEKVSQGKTPDAPGLKPKQREALTAAIHLSTVKVARSSDLESRGMTLADLAIDRVSDLPGDDEHHQVVRAILTLPTPHRRVLRLRYGLGGHEPMTRVAVAARFGVTRERVRQIENEAMKTLRQQLGVAS
jgi:RNA polymerase primary sigma factor